MKQCGQNENVQPSLFGQSQLTCFYTLRVIVQSVLAEKERRLQGPCERRTTVSLQCILNCGVSTGITLLHVPATAGDPLIVQLVLMSHNLFLRYEVSALLLHARQTSCCRKEYALLLVSKIFCHC